MTSALPSLIKYLLLYYVTQLPLINKLVLFNTAFGFTYIGFLLFLPVHLNPFVRLLIGFFCGLSIDLFSNTFGLHAIASTLTVFLREPWLKMIRGDLEEMNAVSVYTLGLINSLVFTAPMVFLHLGVLFLTEQGLTQGAQQVFFRIFFSSVFSLFIILVLNLLANSRTTKK